MKNLIISLGIGQVVSSMRGYITNKLVSESKLGARVKAWYDRQVKSAPYMAAAVKALPDTVVSVVTDIAVAAATKNDKYELSVDSVVSTYVGKFAANVFWLTIGTRFAALMDKGVAFIIAKVEQSLGSGNYARTVS